MDFFTANKEMLGRVFSPLQREVMSQSWSTNVEEWHTRWHLVILEAGMKAGKNYILESDVFYCLYFLSCLKNKWEFFSKITKRDISYSEDINFDIGNASAVNENQARRAFFSRVKNTIKLAKDPITGDNWFERYAGLDIRETFGNLSQEKIEFPTAREGQGAIRLYSFNSEPANPEGYHFFRFYFDEPSRASTKATYQQAKAVFKLAESNTRASFPGRVGKAFAWSYPNDTDYDLITDLYDRSIKDDSVYGMVCTTYDFNLSLTKAMLKDAYDVDEVEAKRIYECIKPISKENFYNPYVDKLPEAIQKDMVNRVNYHRFMLMRETDDGKKNYFTSIELLDIDGDDKPRCFAGDYSINGDRFVIVGGYDETISAEKMKFFLDDKIEIITTNVRPVIDIMIVIDPIGNHAIDYLAVGNILTQLKLAFPNIRSFNTDRYQNEKLRQELIHKGINSQSYGFSNPQQFSIYTKKKWCISTNNLKICNDTKEEHLIDIGSKKYSPSDLWLLEGQKLIREGQKITHAEIYSKDVQDAIAICVNDLLKLEAAGESMVPSRLEELTEEKFRDLLFTFIEMKFDLTAADYPEDAILQKISEDLKLDLKDVRKLDDAARETYGENPKSL